MAQARPYIESHTALRGVAAFTVLIDHLRSTHFLPPGGWVGHFSAVFRWDDIAVFVFFMLSGFVMSYVYPTPVSWKHFFTARLARLVPVYEASLFAVLPLLLWTQYEGRISPYHPIITVDNIAANMLLIQQWFPLARWYSINHPAWSLSVEAFLYVVFFPLLVVSRQTAGRSLIYISMIVIGLVGGTLLYQGWFSRYCMALLPGLMGFAVGFGAENLMTGPLRFPRIVAGAAVLLIGGSLLYLVAVPNGTRFFLPMGLLLLLVSAVDPKEWTYRLLANRPLLYVGDISYSLYLCHLPIFLLAAYVRNDFEKWPSSAWERVLLHGAEAFILIALSFGVAVISYHFLEVPFRRIIRDQFIRPEPGMHQIKPARPRA